VKRSAFVWALIALWGLWAVPAANTASGTDLSALLSRLSASDVLLVADPNGDVLYEHNATRCYTPASTLKILTGLAAFHHLGASYRFKTEFYLDSKQNLKVKGYGDPLLISEVWQQIASHLADKLDRIGDLVVDDSYFSHPITVPGTGSSTNPFDAPVGALCANFNTVFYKYDKQGRIVSAESQTPITPLARKKIPDLGTETGRYTFLRKGNDVPCYAGEVLLYFLDQRGVSHSGENRTGLVETADRLLYTHRSPFSLEALVGKMLTYSNNFMANQTLISMGAHVYGPPATLEKGVAALNRYGKEQLGLQDLQLVEGSGISRKNRLSARDMLRILKSFSGYRHLLTNKGTVRYKSGTLKGIRSQAGYIEPPGQDAYFFVIFLKNSPLDIERLVNAVAERLQQSNEIGMETPSAHTSGHTIR